MGEQLLKIMEGNVYIKDVYVDELLDLTIKTDRESILLQKK